ncbi:MAG: MlaD family protein [Actinomycetota bacterium]|nr:MlaD family protein [Actinomycetota bacterium]
MQKQAPSFGRILTMVLFALSCFGLLLFLWLSFGGPIPLKPQGYRFKVAFPEATQLGLEADVRTAGVTVGKVRQKDLDPHGNRTVATLEIDKRYAPVRTTARAILRQKTLLGETYVELTPGSPGSPTVPEGHFLRNSQVAPTVELDEIFNAFDPQTRAAFREWQQSLAASFQGQGQNISDAFGNLPVFATDATVLTQILDQEAAPLQRLIRDTGGVFQALTQDEGALRGLIVNSEQVFSATASQNESLAQVFQIFPTFLDESKLTLARLRRFAVATDPLIKDLKPVAHDLKPTLRDVRLLAPDLRRTFHQLGPLIDASRTGLPALRDVLTGARPLLAATGPFLGELNPILEWLALYQHQVADFVGAIPVAVGSRVPSATPGAVGHYLRQISPSGAETVGIHKTRLPTNRGNTYNNPLYLAELSTNQNLIFPNWDCNNTASKGPQGPDFSGGPNSTGPACFVEPGLQFQGTQQGKFPHVNQESYLGR